MIIVTHKANNTIVFVGHEAGIASDGTHYIHNLETNCKMAFAMPVNYFEGVEEIPDDFENNKYCYKEDEGFYINPKWIEPDRSNVYGVSDDLYHAIIDDYTDTLIEEGVIG